MKRKNTKNDQLVMAERAAADCAAAVEKLFVAVARVSELWQQVDKLRVQRDATILTTLSKWDALTADQRRVLSQLVQSVGDPMAREFLESVSAPARQGNSEDSINDDFNVNVRSDNKNEEKGQP